jgi:ribosome assembly protein 1
MAPTKAVGAPRGTVVGSSSQALVKFIIRALPMPQIISDYVLDNLSVLRRLRRERDLSEDGDVAENAEDFNENQDVDLQGDVERTPTVKPEHYWTTLQQKCIDAGGDWAGIADRIWAFGPHGAGGCLLVDSRPSLSPNSWVNV